MTERFLRFLASLRLTLPLLFGLALGAVAGTVIPQNLTPAEYEGLYPAALTVVLKALQLFDVYRSWWFIALLGLLAANLLFCSWQRLPALGKSLRDIPAAPPPYDARRQFIATFFLPGGDSRGTADAVAVFLKRRFSTPRRFLHGTNVTLAAQRGAWTSLAVFAIHGAILLVLGGGMTGAFLGFQGYAVIPEGKTVLELLPRRGDKPIPLPFGLRCDAFTVTFHEDGRRPREFKSLVSILEDGRVVRERQAITVNNPLSFGGIRLYQSDYGPAAPPRVTLRVHPPVPGVPFETTLAPGERAPMTHGGEVRLVRFVANFRDLGPTALVEVMTSGGASYALPVFQHRPDLDQAHHFKDLQIHLSSFQQPYYTVLLASRDPGVPLVWSGFILLAAGLTTAFLCSRRRLWIALAPQKDGLALTVTGEWRRNPATATAFFRRLTQEMKKELGKED
ncbi:MAG: cytochrome c biogenesis protein ResB [Deltaproteobacteria bacterium]|nr:cytochrome c biogenesis protein ResB [Deltaproteobacteria bacterium]